MRTLGFVVFEVVAGSEGAEEEEFFMMGRQLANCWFQKACELQAVVQRVVVSTPCASMSSYDRRRTARQVTNNSTGDRWSLGRSPPRDIGGGNKVRYRVPGQALLVGCCWCW